jgi:hypothetical protein
MSKQLLNLSSEDFHQRFGEVYRRNLVDKNIKRPCTLAQWQSQIIIIGELPTSGLSIFCDIKDVPWC